MTRRIKVPQTFAYEFIVADDKAIGARDKYDEYLRTGDESVLALTATPSYYFFRPVPDDIADDIRSALDATDALEGEQKNSAAQDAIIDAVRAKLLRRTLCGAVAHPIVLGMSKNKVRVRLVEWKIGEPDENGIVESMLGDTLFCNTAFNFLLARTVLTEEEKN